MKRSITLYPHITKKHEKKLQACIKDLSVSYFDGNESIELNAEISSETNNMTVPVIDEFGKWTPEKHGLICRGIFCIHSVDILFGEDGIVSEDATLGLGLQWKSKNSNARGSIKIGEIESADHDVELSFELSFENASIRNSVELSFILYLVLPGENEQNLAIGTVFGELQSLTFILEGTGSTFTVFEKNAPGEPLWSIECDWEEPEYSQFSESVRVTINTGHNAWQLAAEDEERKELLKEIMASCMQIIISDLEPYQYESSGDYEPGSVSAAISYFISRAEINTESNAAIAKTVRAYLDKTMK